MMTTHAKLWQLAERKTKSRLLYVTFKPKLLILLSAHAQTSEGNVLYLDQKDAKCLTLNGFVVR